MFLILGTRTELTEKATSTPGTSGIRNMRDLVSDSKKKRAQLRASTLAVADLALKAMISSSLQFERGRQIASKSGHPSPCQHLDHSERICDNWRKAISDVDHLSLLCNMPE